MKDIVAIIPARGGSKSISKKNLHPFLGKPLIYWTIMQAKESKFINRVIVSTDDEKIKEVSLKYGAEVPFKRPKKISGDKSTDLEVFRHVTAYLQKNEKISPLLLVHLRPTGPVRLVSVIDKAISKMLKNMKYDSLRSVSLASQTPYKMWSIKNNAMTPLLKMKNNKESHSTPRQQLPKVYWQNGYVDIVKPSTVTKKDSMVGKKVLSYIINHDVFEIDYYDDIPKAEKEMKDLRNTNRKKIKKYSV
tara:strand:+ start:128 stop:868 length:741 start_codon:yes stop_codon:yes gene_type:complete